MHRLDAYLKETAERIPEKTALEDPERQASMRYGDLARCAEDVREELLAEGIAAGDRVGIYAPKSIGVVASIFGILGCGAGYVPVDSLAPAERGGYIFKDCGVRAIVVERALMGGLLQLAGESFEEVSVLRVPADGDGCDLVLLRSTTRARDDFSVDGLAYILYTSGSTGSPKGVTHTHASACSFVEWCSQTFRPDELDRFSSHAPFHFDLSILDLYVPIKHGATLVLIGEESGKQPVRLAEVIAERRLTMWYSTPSILRLLVEYGRMHDHDHSALRIVNYAGEVFPAKHLRALKAVWPHARYFNLYGPTETNVCTYDQIPEVLGEDWEPPYSIGRTCSNDSTYVADEAGKRVAAGEEGELYVSGGSVMHGYWNAAERTTSAFYVDPSGRRWYKTGDMVRTAPDGDYVFVGRKDRMVKRRGYRIELGEVEAALYRHPGVKEACAIAIPDEENGVLIKACLSWADGQSVSQIKLKQFSAAHLPLYMIPDRFVFLPDLPKTSTDKIDYQRLLELV